LLHLTSSQTKLTIVNSSNFHRRRDQKVKKTQKKKVKASGASVVRRVCRLVKKLVEVVVQVVADANQKALAETTRLVKVNASKSEEKNDRQAAVSQGAVVVDQEQTVTQVEQVWQVASLVRNNIIGNRGDTATMVDPNTVTRVRKN
jgi:hypothetical protein